MLHLLQVGPSATLLPHSCPQTSYSPSTSFLSSPSAFSPLPHTPGCLSTSPASSYPLTLSGFFNGMLGVSEPGGTELLHYLSSHSVNLACSKEANLDSSSSFRIPGFSAPQSGRARFRSGIFSSDVTCAGSGSVIVFVRRGLSFSKVSASSLFSLDSCSDYAGVGVSSSLSLTFVLPCLHFSNRWSQLLFNLHPSSSRGLFILGDFGCHHPF